MTLSDKIERRFTNIRQVLLDFIDGKTYIILNQDKLYEATKEYFNELQNWKDILKIKDRIDRHKVAALTVHYFLKYQPLEKEKTKLPEATLILNQLGAIVILL